MKNPDFDAKCNRCGIQVRWDGGDCCVGSRPMEHNKPDGSPCLPPPFWIPTSITIPNVKGGFSPLDIRAILGVQPMTCSRFDKSIDYSYGIKEKADE